MSWLLTRKMILMERAERVQRGANVVEFTLRQVNDVSLPDDTATLVVTDKNNMPTWSVGDVVAVSFEVK